jgi:hypothetical protein
VAGFVRQGLLPGLRFTVTRTHSGLPLRDGLIEAIPGERSQPPIVRKTILYRTTK